jgi:hypothetical protein
MQKIMNPIKQRPAMAMVLALFAGGAATHVVDKITTPNVTFHERAELSVINQDKATIFNLLTQNYKPAMVPAFNEAMDKANLGMWCEIPQNAAPAVAIKDMKFSLTNLANAAIAMQNSQPYPGFSEDSVGNAARAVDKLRVTFQKLSGQSSSEYTF